jgi:hypothetical protein
MNIGHLFNHPKPVNQKAPAASCINDASLQILQKIMSAVAHYHAIKSRITVLKLTPPLNRFFRPGYSAVVTGEFKCEQPFFNSIDLCCLILFHFYHLRNDIFVLTEIKTGRQVMPLHLSNSFRADDDAIR